jgi:hypothetical protein
MFWFIIQEYNDSIGDYSIGKEELFIYFLLFVFGPTVIMIIVGLFMILVTCAVAIDVIKWLPEVTINLKKGN